MRTRAPAAAGLAPSGHALAPSGGRECGHRGARYVPSASTTRQPMPPAPRAEEAPAVSVHFVNNVLAAAASYVEDDPDQARDVLAELSAFLSYRLRPEPREVPLAQELEHVAVFVRLQQARFPDRIAATLPARGQAPDVRVGRASVQDPVAQALGRRLGEHPGPARLVLRVLPGSAALEAEVAAADASSAERVLIPLDTEAARP